MDNREHKQPLYEALFELKRLQHLLTHSWSKYYGHFFQQAVGSDTIPFCMVTQEGNYFTVLNPKTKTPTSYFRLEAMNDAALEVTLLRAIDANDHETNIRNDVVQLQKTEAQMTVAIQAITAIQLLPPLLLGAQFYMEKW